MTKHTPGPWNITRHGDLIVGRDDIRGDVAIAEAKFNWQANAHLIAAAPELLAALHEIAAMRDYDAATAAEARNIARAAIAKAGGNHV